MDTIKARIKAYAIEMSPSLEGNILLDLVLNEIVDRVLVYTNREQLVRQYEEDVANYPITDKTDTDEMYYTFWKKYTAYPIPTQIERAMARTVVKMIETLEAKFDSREVKSMSDLEQSVTFSDEVQTYLVTRDDVEILMSIKSMLDKFRIPTVVESI